MSPFYGKFVWYELMTTDTAAATEFYQTAIGWTAKDAGMPGMQYMLLSAGEAQVAGLMQMPERVREAGGQPGWTGYIAVDNVDEAAARVEAAGGATHHPPMDIPGVGRFAVVSDPQGATFALFTGIGSDMPPQPPANTPGHASWHQLMSVNQEAAFAFYADLFGWTKTDALDMGPGGIYQMFGIHGVTMGGMMTMADRAARPSWLYFFNVTDIDAAATRVKDAGGQVTHGPMQVPGGSWIAQCIDPQGAVFAMVRPAG
jgi:predicted enzyme related to lactoylglutathione lyase